MSTLKREAALHELQKMIGIHEVGANNYGPEVEKIQREDTLKSPDIGYSWCQSTQNSAWLRANGELLADGTASVNMFHSWAEQNHYLLDSNEPPQIYDHILYWLNGGWNHVGQIEQVLEVGARIHVHTIEGNTGTSDVLQSDTRSGRDGVYRKDRNGYPRNSIALVRVQGNINPPQVIRDLSKVPHPVPHWVWEWAGWRLGEKVGNHDYRGHRANPALRNLTGAPTNIPAWAWIWLEDYLAKRKAK